MTRAAPSTLRLQCLQQAPFEGPAAIADWAQRRGHGFEVRRLYVRDALPAQEDFDGLVILGGPMGVGEEDRHPWLIQEKAFLRQTLAAGKWVLGVCLGAQLIAEALGARVYTGRHREIGWFPITFTEAARASRFGALLPERLPVFHWHGDTFDQPPGAWPLASSEAYPNQGFVFADRILGLQCHLEVTPDSIRDLIAHGGEDLAAGPFVQSAEALLAAEPAVFESMRGVLYGFLDRLSE